MTDARRQRTGPELHDMDWRDLTSFRVVAEELSFDRASRRLRIAGPAVSRRVIRLEQRCQVRLLDRTTRHTAPTLAGHRLLRAVQRIDDRWWQLLDSFTPVNRVGSRQSAPAAMPATLRIAVYSHALGRLIEALTARWPATVVHTAPFGYHQSTADLIAGHLDAVVGYELPFAPVDALDRVEHQTLVREPIWVALGAGHPLAVATEELSLADLRDESWIVHPDPRLREMVERSCRVAGFAPRIRHVTGEIMTIRALLEAGTAVTLAAPTAPGGGILLKPFVGMPTRRLYVAWNPEHIDGQTAAELLTAFRALYRDSARERNPDYWHYLSRHRSAFPGIAEDDDPVPDVGAGLTRDDRAWHSRVPDLLYFGAVAETLSFARAAERIGVPSPTVSRRVARLERQLHRRLLQRSTRRVVVTPAGHQVLAVLASVRDDWNQVWRLVDP